ncbi:MAG: hypothetical protein KatS3mg050_4749 [Litorilinea sp.]|nr:MAG: hypothetical protein KatS3mg050_4749 [Litorilinea sp.]
MQHKHLSRRRFLQITAATAGLATLAACAPAGTTAPASGGESAAQPAAEQITLTFGHHWEAAFRPRQEEFDRQYQERHPNVRIESTYNTWADHNQIVPTWAAAGTLPDIIYVHGRYAFPWNFEGILISIQSYVDNDEEFNVEGIWEEALRLYQFRGEQYEIPYDHGPLILGYNKDLFDEAGLDYPSPDWTMDDFLEAAIALTDPDKQQWGFSGDLPDFGNGGNGSMLYPWGARLMDDTETQILLDTDEAREALQFWVDLIHVHKASPSPAESQAFEQGPWISGRVAMDNTASWNTPTLASFAPFAWDVAPWPQGPGGRGTGSFGSGFGITRDSKHPDAGWEYLREYLSVDGMRFMWGETGRGSPARKEAYDAWLQSEAAPEHAQYFLEALDNYAITDRPYQTLAGGEILDVMNRQRDLLRNGETTVDAAIEAIITEGTPILEEAAKRLQGS